MKDKAFAQRLNAACDGHPHIPPYGQGRQTWIKENTGVSHEAVRKWFTGEARPRPNKMREISKILEVDEAWLSLGITPDLDPKERRARNAIADGAVNVVAGLIQMNGGNCAFPDDKDPRAAFVDLYAIIRGAQFSIHVALAQQVSEGVYKFNVPKEFEDCTVLGAVHPYPMRVHVLNLTQQLIMKHKGRKGGYYEITVHKDGSEYKTGVDVWPRVHSFADRL